MKFRKSPLDNSGKINVPALERLGTSIMSITINPSQHLQHKDDDIRIPAFVQQTGKMIQSMLNGYKYVLHLELSTKSQNLHYHGIIQFPTYFDLGRFYLHLPKYNNDFQIEIDHISDMWIWYVYVTKQRPIMEPLCNFYKVSYKLKHAKRQRSFFEEKSPLDYPN